MESWENCWGTWNGMTPRDSQIYQRLGALLRFAGGHAYGGSAQDSAPSSRSLLRSAGWQPFVPTIEAANGAAYASTFPAGGGGRKGRAAGAGNTDEVFFTIVGFGNKTSAGVAAATMVLDARYHAGAGYQLFDCWGGKEVRLPAAATADGSASFNVSFELDASLDSGNGRYGASGFGALLLTKNGADPELQALLAKMRAFAATTLGSFSCEGGPQCAGGPRAWPFYPTCNTTHCAGLTQEMTPIPPTKQYAAAPAGGGGSMVQVPGSTPNGFQFVSYGVEWRGAPGRGVGFQFPFEPVPSRTHNQSLTIATLWIDTFPVTNALYAAYLSETNYTPTDTHRWLHHWSASGNTSSGGTDSGGTGSGGSTGSSTGGGSWAAQMAPSDGIKEHPVTYVSLWDARAFCAHYGKRLPHAYEWQWAVGQAPGFDGADQLYPWGNAAPTAELCPATSGGVGVNRSMPGPENVTAHPAGCSAHGVCDVVGNTWEYTDEFADQHSRAVMLKGGSNYYAKGKRTQP